MVASKHNTFFPYLLCAFPDSCKNYTLYACNREIQEAMVHVCSSSDYIFQLGQQIVLMCMCLVIHSYLKLIPFVAIRHIRALDY